MYFPVSTKDTQWLTKVLEYIPQNFLMNILCASYETFRNFVGTVTRPGCRDNNRTIFNQSENVYESYKTFTVNVHFSLY